MKEIEELKKAWADLGKALVEAYPRTYKGLVSLCRWLGYNWPIQPCPECGKWHWAGLPRWGLDRIDNPTGFPVWSFRRWVWSKRWEPSWGEFCSFRCADKELIRAFGPKHPLNVSRENWESFQQGPFKLDELEKARKQLEQLDESTPRNNNEIETPER